MRALRRALILMGLFSLLCYSVAEGARWVFFGQSMTGEHYYDSDSVISATKGLIKVSRKIIYARKMVEDLGAQFPNLHSAIELDEISCPEKRFRVLSITHYNSFGSIINIDKPTASWSVIPADTMIELLYRKICPKK
jgi:hypothetical protein